MKEGCLIVFTGIDGSGKTTQAHYIFSLLKKKVGHVAYVWCRWNPFIFRPLIYLWKRRNYHKVSGDYRQQRNKKIRLLQKSFLRWILITEWIIEYGIQVFFKIRLKIFVKRETIVSDRYFYDSFVDQALNLDFSDKQVFRFLDNFFIQKMFPKPELVIYLDCAEEIAFDRKDDIVHVDYLKERRSLFLKIAIKKNWPMIDGTLPKEDVQDCIKKIIAKRLFINL